LPCFFGIDIGASFTKLAAHTEGKRYIFDRFETAELPPRLLLRKIGKQILGLREDFCSDSKGAIGVGIPGFFNRTTGKIIRLTNLPGWREVAPTTVLSDETDMPAYIENDANLFALYVLFRELKLVRANAVCLVLGSGVGGGIILDGKVYIGTKGFASEPGHIIIQMDGEPCGCGKRGCLEAYVGGLALEKLAKKQLERTGESLPYDFHFYPDEIYRLKDRHEAFNAAISISQKALAIGMANMVEIFDPEYIFIGGGFLSRYPDFYRRAFEIMRDYISSPRRRIKFRLVKNSEQAAVKGAVYLAKTKSEEEEDE